MQITLPAEQVVEAASMALKDMPELKYTEAERKSCWHIICGLVNNYLKRKYCNDDYFLGLISDSGFGSKESIELFKIYQQTYPELAVNGYYNIKIPNSKAWSNFICSFQPVKDYMEYKQTWNSEPELKQMLCCKGLVTLNESEFGLIKDYL
jgi:hypothetical protein